jgi:hypothetical protein
MAFKPIKIWAGRPSVPDLNESQQKLAALKSELTNRYGKDFKTHSKGGKIWEEALSKMPDSSNPSTFKLYHGSYGPIEIGDTIKPGMSMKDSFEDTDEDNWEDQDDTPLAWATSHFNTHNYSHVYEVEPLEVSHNKYGTLESPDVEDRYHTHGSGVYTSPEGFRVKQLVWTRNP